MNEESLNTTGEDTANGSKADELIRQREFGIYLREARQAAGLITADVADRLKLSEDIIKSLENSRVDLLPAPAFTQGYIKAYARLLKIPADEVMHAYDQMVPNKVASLNVTSGVPAQRSSRDSMVKTTSYVLVVLALLLFAFWVQQSGFELSGNFAQLQQSESAEPPVAEQPESDPYPAEMLSGDPVAANETVVTGSTQVAAQPVASEEKKPEVMEKKAEIKIESKPIQKPPVITDSRSVNNVAAAPAPNSVAVTNNYDVINLRASAESWAEVQDVNDRRLFYSLMKAGDSHVIKGRAPFKVFLGNAPSVSVDVNNQAVNISRYIRQNNIAHVKITSQAGTQSGGPRENINQVIDQYVPETSGTSIIE